MTPGLVSTIIPVFNRPRLLREAVGSVLAQTYRPIEIVVIDDGSTDETGAEADALAARHQEVRVIHQANAGAGAAREAGRLAARGEFIQYLDSDDLIAPRKFELQVAGLRAHPECGASYGRMRGEQGTGARLETMFPAMLRARIWQTGAALYRAELIERAGPWLRLLNEEDWEYDARIAAMGVRLHYVDEVVGEIRHEAEARLSGRGMNPAVLRDRARAHVAIYCHARRAGIGNDSPEMQHYARELFLLARQCGAAGLPEESHMLFNLAREASQDATRLQFRAYAAAARLFGWSLTGRIACLSDRLR